MRKSLFVFASIAAFSCAALNHEVTDFWDTTAYENVTTSNATAAGGIGYSGFVKSVATKVCEFFSTLPAGFALILR